MKRFIRDRCGEKYQIKVVKNPDDTVHWEVKYKGDHVGIAKWSFKTPDIMIINDICIRDDSDTTDLSIVDRLIKEQARSKGEIKNYRHKCLGTELLKSLLDLARENKVKQVCGSIIKIDIIRTPNLIEWYEKRGFRKGPPYPGCIKEKAIAWIYLDLD